MRPGAEFGGEYGAKLHRPAYWAAFVLYGA